MQSDRAKLIFAILVIIIFIGSAIAYGVLAILESQKHKPEEPPPLVQKQSIIPGNYTANKIKLKIEKILNRYKFVAETTEEDILKLDSALKSNSFNVYNSRFANIANGKLTYMADLLPVAAISYEEAYKRIKDLNIFENIQLFKYATAELIDKNAAIHLAKDENISYPLAKLLKGAIIETIVSPQTIENDIILATINATVTQQGFIMIAFEESNETAKPEEHSLTQEFEIAELENKLYINGIAKYNYIEFFANLKKEINSEAIKDVNISTSFGNAIIVDINADAISDADLNSLRDNLALLKNVREVALDSFATTKAITINFEAGIKPQQYNELIAAIKQKLSDYVAANNYKLQDATGSINIIAELTNAEQSKEAADYLLNLIGNKLQFVDVKQYAKVSAEKLTADGKEFILEDRYFTAELKPGHKLNEKVKLKVLFYTQRDKVIFVNAVESSKAAENSNENK